jgi:hypothetical protein
MTYKIVEALSSVDLENSVNKLLLSGWKISGSVSICSYIGNNKVITHYAQAMSIDNTTKNIQNVDEKRKELKSQYKKMNG